MLLDGVTAYLPSPLDVTNRALDVNKNQAPLELPSSQQVGLRPFFHHLIMLALWTRLIKGYFLMCMLSLLKLLFQHMLQMHCFWHFPKLLGLVHAAVNRLLWMPAERTDLMHKAAETYNPHVGSEQFTLILLFSLPLLTMQPVDTVAIRKGRLVVQAKYGQAATSVYAVLALLVAVRNAFPAVFASFCCSQESPFYSQYSSSIRS